MFYKLSEEEYRNGEKLKNHLTRSEIAPYALTCGQAIGKEEFDDLTALVGWALHSILEYQGDEPKAKKEYIVIDAPDRRVKKYKDALKEHNASCLLIEKDWQLAKRMACNLIDQMPEEVLNIYASKACEFEHVATWVDGDLKFKCRMDACLPILGQAGIIDWKSTAKPKFFSWTAEEYGYDMQVWAYCFGMAYSLLGGDAPRGAVISLAFEIPFYYAISDKKHGIPGFYKAPLKVKKLGQIRWNTALKKFKEQTQSQKFTNWTDNEVKEMTISYRAERLVEEHEVAGLLEEGEEATV